MTQSVSLRECQSRRFPETSNLFLLDGNGDVSYKAFDKFSAPGGKIVDANHLMSVLKQTFRDVASDESGAAGDEEFHEDIGPKGLIVDPAKPVPMRVFGRFLSLFYATGNLVKPGAEEPARHLSAMPG